MNESMKIVIRELELTDLEDYLYWNHPSREFHKYNGPYYKKNNEEELKNYIEELRTCLQQGNRSIFKNKK